MRFQTIDDLRGYLDGMRDIEADFKVYPISGDPETFHYDGKKKIVVRKRDHKNFDNVDDFICYAFQCDREGYSNTEHVDLEIK